MTSDQFLLEENYDALLQHVICLQKSKNSNNMHRESSVGNMAGCVLDGWDFIPRRRRITHRLFLPSFGVHLTF
jgi:hypothetical protein